MTNSMSDALSSFQRINQNFDKMPYERELRPNERMTSSFEIIRDDFY